jgi:hypothetical protein
MELSQINLPDFSVYGPSETLWGTMPLDHIFSWNGRNYGLGFYDDFLKVGNTSLYDGYIRLASSGCGVAQIASTGNSATTGHGLMRLSIDGNAANDEAVLQLGSGLDVGPFSLINNKDFGFECRLAVSAITVSKWSWFVGMASGGSAGAAITDLMFADTTPTLYATNSFLGFQHLYGESSAVDGMYKLSGGTKQDGATKTKLDTLHTLVATYFVKLGFRYFARDNTLHWYVNGVEDKDAMLTSTETDAAAFPDDTFLTPTIGVKDASGSSSALNADLDWWMAAQVL